MKRVRLGVIGVGGMGTGHAKRVLSGSVPRCRLTAVCDINPDSLDKFDDKVLKYADSGRLIRSGEVDAVLIATPHYAHTTIGIDALQQGLHVLTEKPISVHKADCERLIAAHRRRKQVFSAMFNQRTDPLYIKVKELIDKGKLGKLIRVTWIITSWFRTEEYYKSGMWRATWGGEGGGVLLNQCPHQLDLLQWFLGMPRTVRGFCNIGKHHKIEVEDEVTAYLEYRNGATGVFTTSTGEAPGSNRLEIAGEMGKIVVDGSDAFFVKNSMSSMKFSRISKSRFDVPKTKTVPIKPRRASGVSGHLRIMRNFVQAILDGKPLIAPAREGIRSVELGNAMLYSSLTGKPVELPLDGKAYERRLKKLIRESKFVKKAARNATSSDLGNSFGGTTGGIGVSP